MKSPAWPRAMVWRSPNCPPICKDSSSPFTRPTTKPSTPLRHRRCRGKPKERQRWAVDQMMKAAQASRRLGLTGSVSFTGALAWPFLYPWPQRPPGLIETAFDELARRWRPILDAYEEAGVDLCYEIHPGEDVCDGITFEMFLERTGNHPRCAINYDPSHFVLQQLDYLAFIDIYAERIRAFHVKDAEFNPTGRQGVYSGFQSWVNRAGRFRSLGDGQVDFKAIFSQLAAIGLRPLGGAGVGMLPEERRRTARAKARTFIRDHIIRVTDRAFDDFAGGASDACAGPAGIGPRLSAGQSKGYATWPSHASDWEW